MTVKDALVRELREIVGETYVIHKPEDLIVWEYDGSVDKALPEAVVLPDSTEEVSRVIRVARKYGAPIVARGAG
ncbi:MAG: FAD-binding oxidoreductase, partial [Ardenticatenaceae bacterium]